MKIGQPFVCRIAFLAMVAGLLALNRAALGDRGRNAQRPATAPCTQPDRIGQLILQLGEDDFEVREAATAELQKYGEKARTRLQEAGGPGTVPEIRMRAQRLLKLLDPDVEVIGVYEGTLPEGVPRTGHPTGAITVRIGPAAKAKILVLTSYEPVVWTIDDPGGVVVRVIASGCHRQTVQGLDKAVPVSLFAAIDGNTKDWFFAWREPGGKVGIGEEAETKVTYERLVRRVKELTNHDVKRFQGTYTGSVFEVNGP